MYCYTYVNNINCIVNELLLWSEISSEHPIFIKTVAELSKKNLSKDIIDKLMSINNMFTDLKTKVQGMQNPMYYRCNHYQNYYNIKMFVKEFLLHDKHFLELLPKLTEYGKDDKVWQELINHIIHEQTFMKDLFFDVLRQL